MNQQRKRLFRPQRIYYPDEGKFLKLWVSENPGLTRERIVFREACGHPGVPMFLLLDKNTSELGGIMEDADKINSLSHNGKIVLIASWSEYPRKAWTKEITVGEGCNITHGELAVRAAELFKEVVDDLKGGQDDPYIEDDRQSRYLVLYDQLVLVSVEKVSNEEDDEEGTEDWLQVMISVDIDA